MGVIFRTASWNCGVFSLHTELYWATELWRRWMCWFTCDPPALHLGSNPSCVCHHFSLTGKSAGHTHPPSSLSIRLIVGGSSGVGCRQECFLEWTYLWMNPYSYLWGGTKFSTKIMSLFLREMSSLCSKILFSSSLKGAFGVIFEAKQGYWAALVATAIENQMSILPGVSVYAVVWMGHTRLSKESMAITPSAFPWRSGYVFLLPLPAMVSPLFSEYCTHSHAESTWGQRLQGCSDSSVAECLCQGRSSSRLCVQ